MDGLRCAPLALELVRLELTSSLPQGFECKNAIGKDVVELLQDALDRKHIHVRTSALVNDTCGTLMAAAYERGDCLCGGIFGTGTNGAYVESLEKLTKMGFQSKELEKNKAAGLDTMVVNTEWGAFDNEVRLDDFVFFLLFMPVLPLIASLTPLSSFTQRKVMPFTIFDSRVDRISINPRKQAFEKVRSYPFPSHLPLAHLLSLAPCRWFPACTSARLPVTFSSTSLTLRFSSRVTRRRH